MISVTCISANKLLIDNLTSWTLFWWVRFIFVINPRVDFLGFDSLDMALWSFEDTAQLLYQSPPTWWIQSVSSALNSSWNTDSSLAAFCLLLPPSGLLEISSWHAVRCSTKRWGEFIQRFQLPALFLPPFQISHFPYALAVSTSLTPSSVWLTPAWEQFTHL